MTPLVIEVIVQKIGCGFVEDETTKQKTAWAKVYALDTTSSQNDMFTGFNELHYSVIDPTTLSPSIALANEIKTAFATLKPNTPVKMKFKALMVTISKRQTLSICGLA